MSIIDANLLSTWLQSGRCEKAYNVKLLYTTMPKGTASKHGLQHEITDKIIANSIVFDFQNAFTDTHSNLSNTMCSNAQFQVQAQKLGLNNDDTLVIYDIYGNFCASRIWFMCKAMGFKHVYVLDGGLPKWISQGYPTVPLVQFKQEDDMPSGNFEVELNNDFGFVDQQYIETLISKSNKFRDSQCILDARGSARYSGELPDPRDNVRSGHIPSSCNLHYAELQDEWGAFIPLTQIQSKFDQVEHESKQYIFTCGSGITACILAQAAFMLNYRPLLVYDGSWAEWGSNNKLPIATGTK